MLVRLSSFLAAALIVVVIRAAGAAEPLMFEKDVRPIFKANCFHCHGEEDEKQGNLDLRLARLISAGGDSGPAVVAGNSSQSLLVEWLVAGEMPPEGKGKPLAAKDLATIRAWIDQGAKTAKPEPEKLAAVSDDEKSFWSFQPIGNTVIPSVASSSRSPIDSFLLVELKKHKLEFSPSASVRTLVRRATFDLHGLPPTPDEIDGYLADDAPDSFERMLDQLLASPRYGERWGRHWLDVAGYADSDGYGPADVQRPHAFHYRDYVIQSVNK